MIAKGFAASPTGNRPGTPGPANVGLKVKRTDTATVYALCPTAEAKFPKGFWVAVASQGDELMLRYDGQVMLIL